MTDGVGQDKGRTAGEGAHSDSARRDHTDPGALARDWITLWQSELAAVAADREMRESWQAVVDLWATMATALAQGITTTARAARPAYPPAAAWPSAPTPDAGRPPAPNLTSHPPEPPQPEPPRQHPPRAEDDPPARPAGSADAPGTTAVVAAPDARDAEIERLGRHVAALEARLAELERGSPPRRNRKRKS